MQIGIVLKKWRLMSELSLRDAGAKMGVDAATLLRVESGRSPSGDTLAKILAWLLEA